MTQPASADSSALDAPAATGSADPRRVDRRRFLVSLRNFWFLKYFDSVLRLLAERGHRIHIVGDRQSTDEAFPEWLAAVAALARDFPNVTYGWIPPAHNPRWKSLSAHVNHLSDYLRFLEPQFEQTPVLRRRAARHVSPRVRALLERPWRGRRLAVQALATTTNALTRAISRTDHIEILMREHRPDAVIVTPLVTLGSRQSDVVRASRHLGIPSVFAAGSWDHLSSKARLREIPDSMLVWNGTQYREAVDYHGVPADRIVVSGAQCFDEWFTRKPSRTRDAFCRDVGLASDRPILFYACSSLFWGSPVEATFVERWVAQVRESGDERMREASILIRPHPKRGDEWKRIDLDRFGNVRVWPPFGAPPLTADTKADYFDSLYYADAIIGLNTSAQIEGALVGRPVFTVLLPEFWDNQEGTLHFHYLLEPAGGPLQAARSLPEHLEQLSLGLADPASAARRNQGFVEKFVRPHGHDRSATTIFVEAVERIAARPATPWRGRVARLRTVCAGAAVMPLAYVVRGIAGKAVRASSKDDLMTPGPRLEPHERTRKVARATSPAATRPPRVKPPKVRQAPSLPTWAWTMRGVVYPIVSRVNLGNLSEERLWRAERYKEKERARELELRRHNKERTGRERARERQRVRERRLAKARHSLKRVKKIYERGRRALRLRGSRLVRRWRASDRPAA